jgi:uncharacterized protein (DUF2235 family)
VPGNPTNVAELFGMLDKDDPSRQLAYYDPGVGTLAPAAARSGVPRTLALLYMRAFGTGDASCASQRPQPSTSA